MPKGWRVPVLFSSTATPAFDPSTVSGYSRDWNFADITKLYTDTAGTIAVTADGDPLGAILCSAGSTVKLAAPADASRPTYETNIVNGLSVGRADGTDDYLFNATAITADASQTLFLVVAKRSAPDNSTRHLFAVAASAGILTDTDAAAGYVYNTNGAAAQVSVGGTPANWNILALKYTSAASVSVYVNGGAPTTLDPNDNYATATALYIGANQTGVNDGDYDYGRVLVYSAALSNTALDYLFSGLGTLYNITVTAVS
jgi:hypothetical protein